YHEMLAREDVDAVSICVPSGLRCEIAEACAAAGKHILSEKPLEVTTERIDRILAAVDKAGVKLACVFQSRFTESARAVRKALDDDRFGRLVLGDAYIKWYRSQAYYDSGKWRGTKKLDGGGALMNQGIHQIDLLLWFMGPVKRVQARKALVGHTGLEVEDLACALLEFENGAMGVIEGSTAVWHGHPARVEVHGTSGSVVIEDGQLKFWQFEHETEEDIRIRSALAADTTLGSGSKDPISALSHAGHKLQIADFARSIRDNTRPFIEGREGRRAVELVQAIYRSAETGSPVEL
ncbi:MAG: Gfo/Idh/MocA family oxidoreductase, partial [Candidatus Hydrogenedentales bacterium]